MAARHTIPYLTTEPYGKPLGNPARVLAASPIIHISLFLLLHIPLAQGLALSGWLGTLHGTLVLLFGLHAAVRQNTARTIGALGYIAGSEILWRMTGANLFWEFGKYASVLVLLVALVVEGRKPSARPKVSPWPLIFFALLLPATIPTLTSFGFDQAREEISFNLSGPLLLALLAHWLWKRPLGYRAALCMLVAIAAPVLSIAVRAGLATYTQTVTFVIESNFVTSGGYGPNQVSNMLGFGALSSFLLFLLAPRMPLLRLIFLLLAAVFITQAALTFSRGGVISFLLASVVAGLHLMTGPQTRWRFVVLAVVAYTIASTVALPRLNAFTDGLLLQRFSELETTGRSDAIEADLYAFGQHPVTGAGVGMGNVYRRAFLGRSVAAHTEFTRLLGEHGLLGLSALLLLLALLTQRYRQNTDGSSRAFVAAFAVWGLSVMAQSAMRFAAIPLAIGLAFACWQIAPSDEDA